MTQPELKCLDEVLALADALRPSWAARAAAIEGPVCLEMFPGEGLDHLLGVQPRNGQAPLGSTFIGLFRAQTSSTVPPFATILSTGSEHTVPTGAVQEVETAGSTLYARLAIAGGTPVIAANAVAGDWGAIANGSIAPSGSAGSRMTTSAQKTLAESGAAWGTVNGFFIASNGTRAGGFALYYANFNDNNPVVINSAGYTLKLTPFWEMQA